MTGFQNVGVITPSFSTAVILHTYPPMKMEQTVCSETSAYKIQTPGNYPEESIQNALMSKVFIAHWSSSSSSSSLSSSLSTSSCFNRCSDRHYHHHHQGNLQECYEWRQSVGNALCKCLTLSIQSLNISLSTTKIR